VLSRQDGTGVGSSVARAGRTMAFWWGGACCGRWGLRSRVPSPFVRGWACGGERARGGGRGGLVRCCAPVLRDRSLAFRDNVRVRVRAVLLARLLACSDFLHGHAPPGCRLLPARRSIPRRVPALRTQATKARRVWRVRDDGRQAQPARRRRERTCPLLPCPTPTRCMLSSRDGCPVDTP